MLVLVLLRAPLKPLRFSTQPVPGRAFGVSLHPSNDEFDKHTKALCLCEKIQFECRSTLPALHLENMRPIASGWLHACPRERVGIRIET
ncbi:hypothetical protein D3C71_1636100 [compost metagenome]